MKKHTVDKTWLQGNKVLEYHFTLDLDVYEIKREIYTIWELFGDFGGLTEIAVMFAGLITGIKTLFFGSALDQHLLS